MKRKAFQFSLIAATILSTLIAVQGIFAQGDSTTTVINAINQLRVRQELTPLVPHSQLMGIAQQHSQYLASLGTETETGTDGSSPQDRAENAGFGAGAEAIQIFENDACGISLDIQGVLETSWSEPGQEDKLLHPESRYIGAGVAYAGDLVCYTVVTGYWVGDPDPTQPLSPTPGTPASSEMPTAVPVAVSTPGADGTVRHTVANGQTLWIIAAVYNIPLEDLRELNGLDPDTVVNPGNELIIEPPYTPTNTPIGEPSPTLPLRFTHTPSPVGFQGTPVVFSPASPSPTGGGISEPRFRTSTKNPTVVIAAVLVSGVTLAAALAVSLRNRS